jgi:hypothetical protein
VNHAAVSNYRPLHILSNFFKFSEFIIHGHVSHYAIFNLTQHGSTRTKSTVTNLVTFLDFLTSVVRGQRQVDAVHFDFKMCNVRCIARLCSGEFYSKRIHKWPTQLC